MRQIVIDRIRASNWYKQCCYEGIDVPVLEKETDEELLCIYWFAATHS